MRQAWTIALKELRTYFISPIGYVVCGSFLFMIGYMFYQRLVFFIQQGVNGTSYPQPSLNDAIIKPLYAVINIVMLFVVPLITMRLISEERRSKTIELLLTSPIRPWEVLLGKFLGAMTLVMLSLVGTLIYPGILFIGGNPDPGQIFSMYIGVVLLSAVYVSVGVLWSATTENQIVSAILTFVSLVFLWIVDWASQNTSHIMSLVLSYISVIKHFEYFGQGVLSLKDTIYYFSFTVVLLSTARYIFDINKNIKDIFRLATLLIIIILINISAYFHDLRLDLTRDNINTLSEQTKHVLDGLKDNVHFTAVLDTATTGQVFRRAMEQYSYYTDKLSYKLIDRKETKTRFESITLSYKGKNAHITSISEEDITGAIVAVTRTKNKKIYFISGHGEVELDDASIDGVSFLIDRLRGYGYEVNEYEYPKIRTSDPSDIFIMVGPTKHISMGELRSLKRHLDNGGNVIVLSSPPLPGANASNINDLTAETGIVFGGGVVIDPGSSKSGLGQAVTIINDLNRASPVNLGLKDPLIFPYSQSLRPTKRVGVLCKSSQDSWLDMDIASDRVVFDKAVDRKGPFVVCASMCTKGNKGCLLAIGNSSFVSNRYINFGSNYDFILNSIFSMLNDNELVLPRSGVEKPGYFRAGASFVVGFVAMYLIPSILLIFGVWSYYRRKKK